MTVAWDLRIWIGVCPSNNDRGLLRPLGLMGQLGRMLWRTRRLIWLVQLLQLLHQLSKSDRVALFLQAKSLPVGFRYMENPAKDVPLSDVSVGIGNLRVLDAEAVIAPYNAKAHFVSTVVGLTVFEDGFG